ncbi:MAG TPA: barstar family protein [Burkholderiales bacterium]|nr:barstar family protein [Burkholderiales bacterium]
MTEANSPIRRQRVEGVFRSSTPVAAKLNKAGELANFIVKLNAVRDKTAFLNAIAKAMAFPEYFGHNWDGLYDCLLDKDPGPGGAGIVFEQASGFARAEPDEFAAAVDTLTDAADYWKDEGKILLAVFELDAPALAPELAEFQLSSEAAGR